MTAAKPKAARMTAAELIAARQALGLTAAALGRTLLLETRDPGEAVRRWETGVTPVPGPVTIAVRLLVLMQSKPANRAAPPQEKPPEALAPIAGATSTWGRQARLKTRRRG
jgi:DNA-binding transcriptional regulator YiaG